MNVYRYNSLFLLLTFVWFAFSACKSKEDLSDIEYIKVLSFGRPASVTVYNKGIGLYAYAYYQPKNDSMLYWAARNIDSNIYLTQAGKLESRLYVDTISRLLDALEKYPNPITFDTTYNGDVYDGPELYVEYRNATGIHYYDFILDRNDTLNQFCHFFNRLETLPWPRKIVDTKRVNADEEAVKAVKRLGLYDKRETPYISPVCTDGIDRKKIYGAWRTTGMYLENHESHYTKYTFNNDGTWASEKVLENKVSDRKSGKFSFISSNAILSEYNGVSEKYIIIKLSGNCFEFRNAKYDYVTHFDSLQ